MKKYTRHFWFKWTANHYKYIMSLVCENIVLEKKGFMNYKVYVSDKKEVL